VCTYFFRFIACRPGAAAPTRWTAPYPPAAKCVVPRGFEDWYITCTRGCIAGEICCGDFGVADDHEAERIEKLRAAIRAYLGRSPHAGDTAEGIVASWLPQRGYEDALQWIDDVIAVMVSAGELTPRLLPDGRVLYVRGPALPAGGGATPSK
jgi:hypothetical protein